MRKNNLSLKKKKNSFLKGIPMNSNFWVFIILLGMALVTMGNIYFNSAKDTESKAEMAKQALDLLEPELKRNLQILHEALLVTDNAMTFNYTPFETEAWQTVAQSNLLVGIDTVNLSRIIRSYFLLNRANNIHGRLAENKSSAAKAASNNTNEDLFLCLNETLLEAMKEITSIESLKLPKSADISDMADAIKDKINQRATKLGIPTSQNNDNTSIASETATNK